MEDLLLDIIAQLRANTDANNDPARLERTLRRYNKQAHEKERRYAKKYLFPYYLRIKNEEPAHWQSWNITPELEKRLIKLLQIKPRRTASGVATITVLTKPWKCGSNCLYCPNDLRMPKSYLTDEPACQRAERNFFDPYLQVASRLRTLTQMGHTTDKVELIVLGGTWSDYPQSYQVWFVTELFRALNDLGREDAASYVETQVQKREDSYKAFGIQNERDVLRSALQEVQQQVLEGALTYNQAMVELYERNPSWQQVSATQKAAMDDLRTQHALNENGKHRCVGLVIETRPDSITTDNLFLIRQLGCTKVQIGIQSLNPDILRLNHRGIEVSTIQRAFALLRLFGFKIHIHFMANLFGANPEADKADYRKLVTESTYLPDEVKLYPCALVAGTGLCAHFEDGSWKPYSEETLVEVLVDDLLATPPYTRVSRMIRDISSHDILAGNKKVNLRQLVEERAQKVAHETNTPIREIRFREIATGSAERSTLSLEVVPYETSVSQEYFLQWTTPEHKIAGFLRLSLPKQEVVKQFENELPIHSHEAMIREVHVYGKVAGLHEEGSNAQHTGLGKRLIQKACEMAREAGYDRTNVISAIGTREYYRNLGFADAGLYQQKLL